MSLCVGDPDKDLDLRRLAVGSKPPDELQGGDQTRDGDPVVDPTPPQPLRHREGGVATRPHGEPPLLARLDRPHPAPPPRERARVVEELPPPPPRRPGADAHR